MANWLKISPHYHSGQLRPHEHTSYLPLAILLAIVSFPLLYFTAEAATPYTGPEAGSIGISGIVPAPPPTTAATITSPKDGQHFIISPVTFSGTCPKNTLVEMYKNDIFGGSSSCTDQGTFSIDVDLLYGENKMIARVYDALNQPGPDSNTVTVYYDVLPPQLGPLSSLDFGGAQLLLNTDAAFRGVFPGKEMSFPLDIIGGTPPYAVNIQWGDANNKVVSRNDNVTFRTPHTYQKAGIFQISIQATDSQGRAAFMTVAAIVNGQPDTVTTTSATTSTTNKLLLLWPLYTAAVAVLLSFWLGERREKAVLAKHGLIVAQ